MGWQRLGGAGIVAAVRRDQLLGWKSCVADNNSWLQCLSDGEFIVACELLSER